MQARKLIPIRMIHDSSEDHANDSDLIERPGIGIYCFTAGYDLLILLRDAKSIQGMKHVKTLNVRLVRPQNGFRKKEDVRQGVM